MLGCVKQKLNLNTTNDELSECVIVIQALGNRNAKFIIFYTQYIISSTSLKKNNDKEIK